MKLVQHERKGRLEDEFSLLCLGFLRLNINNMISSIKSSKKKVPNERDLHGNFRRDVGGGGAVGSAWVILPKLASVHTSCVNS